MRLRFWYLIAEGTEGQCLARVAQYRDTPTAWKVLAEGAHEECLTTVGRWVKVERVLRTEPDATTLALDFRISNSDIGEMWIDDVSPRTRGGRARRAVTGPHPEPSPSRGGSLVSRRLRETHPCSVVTEEGGHAPDMRPLL